MLRSVSAEGCAERGIALLWKIYQKIKIIISVSVGFGNSKGFAVRSTD